MSGILPDDIRETNPTLTGPVIPLHFSYPSPTRPKQAPQGAPPVLLRKNVKMPINSKRICLDICK